MPHCNVVAARVAFASMAAVKDLAEEIEFFVPTEGLDLQHYLDQRLDDDAPPKAVRLRKQAIHHLARYYWAAKVLASRPAGTVLDVACGSGYGTAILSKALPQFAVTGGDYDPRAVEYANETFSGGANLTYRRVDVVTWQDPVSNEQVGQFDYVVSFDTLEHLLHREIALINFSENIATDGALLFSTPARSDNLLNPGWEHHKLEYSYRYLYNMMCRFFERVQIPDNETLPELTFWKDIVNKDRQEYLLRCNPLVCEKPIVIETSWPPKP